MRIAAARSALFRNRRLSGSAYFLVAKFLCQYFFFHHSFRLLFLACKITKYYFLTSGTFFPITILHFLLRDQQEKENSYKENQKASFLSEAYFFARKFNKQ